MIKVGLLRGINVGGNNKVPMKKLAQMVESMGAERVITYINSGNVVFKDPQNNITESELENEFEKVFGFKIRWVIRTQRQIKKLHSLLPQDWGNDSKIQKTDILFWYPEAAADLKHNIGADNQFDSIIHTPTEMIWHIKHENYSESDMSTFTKHSLYRCMTARNINTVRKIAGIMESM